MIDLKKLSEEAEAKNTGKADRKSPFFDAYFKGYTQTDLKAENIDWVVFIGSTYILELDASKDFQRMANVLPDKDLVLSSVKKGILSVAQDETRHASYLYEALHRRLSPAEATTVIDQWRTRKVEALWAMVGNFIERNGETRNLVQDGAPTETMDEVQLTELEAA